MKLFTTHRTLALFILVFTLLSFNRDEPKLDLIEKVYAHVDRPLYFPGETIWFKAYVVNASNTISAISEMMYADLLSPKGSVVKTLRLQVRNGYAYGSFPIAKDWVGGIYSLKMYTNWMRNYNEEMYFTKNITVQKVVQPNLLMQLEFEKEGYGKAAEVTADFEVKDLKNQPLVRKKVSVGVMIDGKTFWTKNQETDADGKLRTTFRLPNDLQTTDVLLNVLIPYKGSTESISRSVPVLLDNIDLQFFPESGKMIQGTQNTIAFKALNEYGKPADISGVVYNEAGNHIADFNSFHDGMGSFEFKPQYGQNYHAQITKPFVSKKKIHLPDVYENGVRFSVVQDEHKMRVALFSNSTEELELRISNEGSVLMQKAVTANRKPIRINTSKFPKGITNIAILNDLKQIVAERLVFVEGREHLQIDLQIEKETFDTREKVTLNIKTKDNSGSPVSSNLSIAIADNKLLSFADDKQDHIMSYLLMSSELRGKIHKPVFYFDREEPKATKALDYVMLTHGWREHITRPKVSLMNARFQPEQMAIQNGLIVDTKGNPKKAHLILFDDKDNKAMTFETDEDGRFAFKLSDNKRYTMVAYTDDNAPLYIRAKNKEYGFSSNSERKNGIPNPTTPEGFFGIARPNQTPVIRKAEANFSLAENAAALDEVVVIGYGTTKKTSLTSAVVSVRAEDISLTDQLADVLSGRASGVHVTNSSGLYGASDHIKIRGLSSFSGNSDPLIIVDGVPVRGSELTPDQISSVSVLKGMAATSLYGSRGSNGVILISSKSYRNNYYNKKKLNNKKHKNYASRAFYSYGQSAFDTATKFYAPIYAGEHLPEERTDFRNTIYWNPVVQTNAKGEATLEYYNSDAVTSFKITAEGIGHNGLLGRAEKDYGTKKMLSVDFKLPSYITLNDVVVLPLTFTNETNTTLFSELELDLPKHLKLATEIDRQINIPAHSSIVKNVRVIAMKKGTDIKIRARIAADDYQDVTYKNATVLSPYFPMETSISGIESASYEFEVDEVAPNSLHAEFTLYTDIIGDVMNGVESMIRKPYGCFEQVSSATYPNVMILKYLREAGKSRPKLERRAKKYIENGYQRMAAYETLENGFEWYGNTPPHEALSAYGLMQFKEMKEVYDGVDPKLVERTIDWLLSRKNGEGGFHQNKGKYGFSSAPAKVNNAYIVYALTEAEVAENFEKEYRAAYDDALDSLDTYKLALTALSSHNLNKTSDYSNIMSYLKSNIEINGFEKLPVENTITRSWGDAKNIEATAFTVLALLRDYKTNELLIAKGVEHLLKKRRFGGFGSTQSTAMALKVLIAYSKMQKAKIVADDHTISIALNGKVIQRKLQLADNGKIRIDSLQKYIKEGKQTLSVKFSDPKVHFPYNLNVQWDSDLPASSENCWVDLQTDVVSANYKVGDIVRMSVAVKNTKNHGLPMTTAIIGIPAGTAAQPWQLKEILEEKKVAFYEIFDNYLVFYWREMGPGETKVINLDLKAEIAGNYKAPASSAYLYYADEFKKWISGNEVTILE